MKKKLLLVVALVMAATIGMMAQTPAFQWAKLIDGSNGEGARNLLKSADNKILAFVSFGSRQQGDAVDYDGVQVADGAATTSSSDNLNALVMKLDADGTKMWGVYTDQGDIDLTSSSMAATSDGGAVVALKIRYAMGSADIAPELVDAKGNKISLQNWDSDAARVYYVVLMKISSDGEVVWTKTLDIDSSGSAAATNATYKVQTANGVYANGLAVDADNNIYLGGNYRKTMIFKTAKNRTITVSPHNTDGWNGDSQGTVGDMYLVKFDAQGNYLKHITTSGVNARDMISDLVYDNGKLYFAGNILPSADGATTSLGNVAFTTSGTLDGIMYGCLDTDFAVQYVKTVTAYGASDGKHTTQLKRLQLLDGNLYLTGLVKGGFSPEGAATALLASTGTPLEGFVIKASASTGDWVSGTVNGKSIGGYFGIVKEANRTLAYGYKMGTIFLDEYSEEDSWTRTAEYNLVTGGICTAWSHLVLDNKFYSLTRANNTLSFLNSTTTVKPQSWGVAFTCFNLDSTTGVSSVDAADAFSVVAVDGGVKVSTSQSVDVKIFNTLGQAVYAGNVPAGNKEISLSKGAYIVNGQKVIVY